MEKFILGNRTYFRIYDLPLYSVLIHFQTNALYYKTLELQRKAESYFQHTESTFPGKVL